MGREGADVRAPAGSEGIFKGGGEQREWRGGGTARRPSPLQDGPSTRRAHDGQRECMWERAPSLLFLWGAHPAVVVTERMEDRAYGRRAYGHRAYGMVSHRAYGCRAYGKGTYAQSAYGN